MNLKMFSEQKTQIRIFQNALELFSTNRFPSVLKCFDFIRARWFGGIHFLFFFSFLSSSHSFYEEEGGGEEEDWLPAEFKLLMHTD